MRFAAGISSFFIASAVLADPSPPTVFSDVAQAAFLGERTPVTYEVEWDFVGAHSSVIAFDDDARQWLRQLYNTYQHFEEIRFAENRLEVVRSTVPEDVSDPLPDMFVWHPAVITGQTRPLVWPNSTYRMQYELGITLSPDMPQEEQDRLNAWTQTEQPTSILYMTQWFTGEEWRAFDDFDGGYQAYDLRTMRLYGNEITLSYWESVPHQTVSCLVNITQEQVLAELDAHQKEPTGGASLNIYAPDILNYVSWSLSPFEDVRLLSQCGSQLPAVVFSGHIDFGEGAHFGLFPGSKAFIPENATVAAVAQNGAPAGGWELRCEGAAQPRRYNQLVMDCTDLWAVRAQIRTAVLTLATQGNTVIAGQCQEWLSELWRVSEQDWPPDYPQRFFNRCNDGLQVLR